jgi:hypothetical protein
MLKSKKNPFKMILLCDKLITLFSSLMFINTNMLKKSVYWFYNVLSAFENDICI